MRMAIAFSPVTCSIAVTTQTATTAGAIIIANEANAAAAITEAAVDADGDAAVIEAAVRLLLLLEISEAVLPACKAAIGTSSVVAQTNGFAVLELYCRDCSPDKIDNCIELDIAPQLLYIR